MIVSIIIFVDLYLFEEKKLVYNSFLLILTLRKSTFVNVSIERYFVPTGSSWYLILFFATIIE